MREKHGDGFARRSLWSVFGLQALVALVVSLPVQVTAVDGEPLGLGTLSAIGAVVCVASIAFETVADLQLARFLRGPASGDAVMDEGLWRYSRHPNYFGDALLLVGHLADRAGDGRQRLVDGDRPGADDLPAAPRLRRVADREDDLLPPPRLPRIRRAHERLRPAASAPLSRRLRPVERLCKAASDSGERYEEVDLQLGMIGLGRMGANLVRRLMRDGHECVVYDVNADAIEAARGRGRDAGAPRWPSSSRSWSSRAPPGSWSRPATSRTRSTSSPG